MKYHIVAVVIVVLVIGLMSLTAFAQTVVSEATPQVTPASGSSTLTVITSTTGTATGNENSADFAGTIALLLAIFQATVIAAFGTAPVTTFIVSLLKKVKSLDGVPAPIMNFIVAAVLWILATLFERLGVRQQFNSVLDLITTVGPILIGFIATMIGAHVIFEAASKANVPIIGASRELGPS